MESEVRLKIRAPPARAAPGNRVDSCRFAEQPVYCFKYASIAAGRLSERFVGAGGATHSTIIRAPAQRGESIILIAVDGKFLARRFRAIEH